MPRARVACFDAMTFRSSRAKCHPERSRNRLIIRTGMRAKGLGLVDKGQCHEQHECNRSLIRTGMRAKGLDGKSMYHQSLAHRPKGPSRATLLAISVDYVRAAQNMMSAGRAGRPIPKGALRSRAPAGSYSRAIAAALRVTVFPV